MFNDFTRCTFLLYSVLVLQEQIEHLRSESESMRHFPPLQAQVCSLKDFQFLSFFFFFFLGGGGGAGREGVKYCKRVVQKCMR